MTGLLHDAAYMYFIYALSLRFCALTFEILTASDKENALVEADAFTDLAMFDWLTVDRIV